VTGSGPVHALTAGAAGVLVPLGAVVLLVAMLAPRSRGRLRTVTLVLLALGAAAALLAAITGTVDARRWGVPRPHADHGGTLPVLAVMLLVLAAVWFILQDLAARRVEPHGRAVGPGIEMLAGIALLGLLFATLVTTAAAWFSGGRAADLHDSHGTVTSTLGA